MYVISDSNKHWTTLSIEKWPTNTKRTVHRLRIMATKEIISSPLFRVVINALFNRFLMRFTRTLNSSGKLLIVSLFNVFLFEQGIQDNWLIK